MAYKVGPVWKGVGSLSGLAGVLVGSAASAGKKMIAGGGNQLARIGRNLFSMGKKQPPRASWTVEEREPSPPDNEFFSLESPPEHNADTESRAKELEFEVADAQRELDQARDKARKAQSHLTSQLSNLQKEMMSPLFELRNMEAKRLSSRTAGPAARQNADTQARASKLESELAEEQEVRSDLMSKLDAMREEKASIIKDLTDARREAADARDRIRDVESEAAEEPPSREVCALSGVTPDDVRDALFGIESEREIVQRSLSDITEGNEETRSEAAQALGSVHHKLAVGVLADRVAREPSARVRAECVSALATLGMRGGLPAVERALTDRAACVRLAAVQGVYRLAGAGSVPMLVSALADENETVRHRASLLTGWLGQNDTAAKIQKLLEKEDPPQRSAHGAAEQAKEGMEDAL